MYSTIGIALAAFFITGVRDKNAVATLLTALESCGLWLLCFGFYHLFRTPWLVHGHTLDHERPAEPTRFGVLGLILVVAMMFGTTRIISFLWHAQTPDAPRLTFQYPAPPQVTYASSSSSASPKILYRDDPAQAAELNRFRRELDKSDKKADERKHIASFLSQGLALQQKCLSMQIDPQVLNDGNEWSKNTYHYLLKIDPSFSSRFDASEGLTYTHGLNGPDGKYVPLPKPNEDMWNFLNQRMETLKKLLEELKD